MSIIEVMKQHEYLICYSTIQLYWCIINGPIPNGYCKEVKPLLHDVRVVSLKSIVPHMGQ